MISLGPHVLGRIEFRCVRREGVGLESRMSREECTDFSPAMNWTAIPEQVDRSAQMTQEVTEKGLDVDPGEVMRTTPEVERHPPMLRRDCHPAADGQPIVAVPVPDTRRLPLRRPSPPNIGYEQEPALIDEHEMGATSRGAFFPPPFVAGPARDRGLVALDGASLGLLATPA